MTVYQLTDRRHDGRVVRVQADHIAATVAAWLAELDARSSLVELPSRAVRDGERNATVWLTAAASNGPPTCCFTRPCYPFFKSHLRASTSVDQSACGGILGIFHSPLLGKTRLATLR
jgi:hypothetical protein